MKRILFVSFLIITATCFSLGQVRVIMFAGVNWIVRPWEGAPGPNQWSDDLQSVWVDTTGELHLKIRRVDTVWYCSEVSTQGVSQYGIHRFYVVGRLDSLDKNVVFSPFLYRNDSTEIDIEFSKWGQGNNDNNAQFVVQPGSVPGNAKRFPVRLNGSSTTQYIDWEEGFITFKSISGHYQEPPDPGYLLTEPWTYTGPYIPQTGSDLAVHINLWLVNGWPPSDGKEVEVVVSAVDLPAISAVFSTPSVATSFSLSQNYPNPFNPSTTISYALPQRSHVMLTVFNTLGQQVSTLVNENQEAGDHKVRFDGGGLASGVYFYRLQAGDFVQSKKLLLLR